VGAVQVSLRDEDTLRLTIEEARALAAGLIATADAMGE
jgi:hypothetical protein